MSRRLRGWLRLLGLASCLFAGVPRAVAPPHENPPEVLAKAGALLGEMKELGQAYWDAQHRRGMTAEKRTVLAHRSARRLVGYRNDLARLQSRLDPTSEFAARLAAFLARWPDEETFRVDLLADQAPPGGVSQGDITALWLMVPDRRRKSRTLFPIFRP